MKTKIVDDVDLKKRYVAAKAIVTPTPAQARQRGYELESMIEYLLKNLEVRTSFKTDSEQVDGSFFLWGQTFLLEAKWHKDSLPVSSIYSFKGKVDGKFHTTSGVFISINGFSKDAVTALRYGKSINVLLFEGSDLDAIIERDVPFEDVLKFKLRMAGDTGSPHALYKLVTTSKTSLAAPPIFSGSTIPPMELRSSHPNPYLVFYSSSFHKLPFEQLFADLDTSRITAYRFNQLTAEENPLDTIPVLINLYNLNASFEAAGVMVILDKENDSKELNANLRFNLPDILENTSQPVPIHIFSLNSDQVNNWINSGIEPDKIHGIPNLLSFLDDHIQTDNPFYDDKEAYKAIKKSLEDAEWDFETKTVYLQDSFGDERVALTTYDEFFSHLTQVGLNAASAETPSGILSEGEFPEYDSEVEELMAFYKTQIRKMGWQNEQ